MDPVSTHILTVRAFQIAEAIDIKRCRTDFPGELIASAPQELFYRRRRDSQEGEEGYLYIMDYGLVSFAGYGEAEMSLLIDKLQAFSQGTLATRMGEDFRVHAGAADLYFGYNDIHVPDFNADVLRIVMLYVGQSAALDHYESLVNGMMAETGRFTRELELHGRLKASRANVQKFIGRILSIRNRIIDNLYIMDAPDITWESEYLDKVDRGMKKTFDVIERFRSLDYQLREVKENLELFAELLQFRQSNMLEWIIIALILVEVVHLFR